MTTVFFKLNQDTHILRRLIYNPTTKNFDIKTEDITTEEEVFSIISRDQINILLEAAFTKVLHQHRWETKTEPSEYKY